MPDSSPLQKFLGWEQQQPNRTFLKQPIEGKWKSWSWREAGIEARKMATALKQNGLQPGDHVAILSKNCAQWIIADLAIMMAGCVSIPIYPTLTASAIQPILEHSQSKAIFLGKLDDFAGQAEGIPAGVLTIGMNMYQTTGTLIWEKLIASYEPLKQVYEWQSQDILTIIYTSGTTGQAKGVMHCVEAVDAVLPLVLSEYNLPQNPDLFSYLPLSHIAERLAIEMHAYYLGGCIAFSESLETFAANLAAIQPTVFVGVPRIYAKFKEGVLNKIPQSKLSWLLAIPFLKNVVRKGIKEKLGLSRAKVIINGAAPISVDLQKWYRKLGIVIVQVYGMTEDCVYNHAERTTDTRMGSVGKPLPGLQTKIAEDGEILLKSKGNMKGYYREPELTAAAFDEDGYLRSGDIGEYDHDGFLFITGRAKDQFKTDKGKYISPGPIELKFSSNTDVEQVCVVGAGIPQPIALVTLSETGRKKSKAEIISSLIETLGQVNDSIENYEALKKAVIMKENWTIANGLMTPSLKVKRNQVEKIHNKFYTTWFNSEDKIIWE